MKQIPHLICDNKLQQNIQSNMEKFDVQTHPRKGVRRAAVAITVVDVSDDPGVYDMKGNENRTRHAALILTRRSAKLQNHATQWAFPGGRMDAGERAEDTALRELEEEVGLQLGPDSVIGRLDDFTTRSGFVITPVVVWGGRGIDLTPNPAEVSSIHRIPIEEFLRDDAPLLEESQESKHPILKMPVGSSWIAAPTAALIYQFREVAILGRNTRVAHFEQPYFAWS